MGVDRRNRNRRLKPGDEEKNTRRLSARQYARGRLFEWGNVVRSIVLRDIPNPDVYNVQPFFNPRIDFNRQQIETKLAINRRFERALEVDEILIPVRDTNPHSYRAVVIRFVLREPGHPNRKLPHDEQVALFYKQTGLGQWSFYARLARVEAYIAMALG